MALISDPGLIHYICIAKGTTILAEFNSKDAALGAIAAKCLEKTPPFHATFTYTVLSKTYAFLIDEPFVYFAIFDEKLESSRGLEFLRSVRDAFVRHFRSQKELEKLSSHCFQGEFILVFRHLLGLSLCYLDGIESPTGQRTDESESFKYGSAPVRGRAKVNGEKGLKNRLIEEVMYRRNVEKGSDENRGNAIVLSPESSIVMHKSRGLYSGELSGHQKAKKVWKKQVWVVLSLDLITCVILFVVWLWVCRGLKCMES